jgi:hypothetical protein
MDRHRTPIPACLAGTVLIGKPLRDGIRCLLRCKECFEANGRIPDEYREGLARFRMSGKANA